MKNGVKRHLSPSHFVMYYDILAYMLMFLVLIHLFLGDYLAQGMAEVYAEVAGMNFSSMRWLVDSTAITPFLSWRLLIQIPVLFLYIKNTIKI